MKRIFGVVSATVVLLALVVTSSNAAVINNAKQLMRAKYAAGVPVPDSSVFILEGNTGSTPTSNDTTAAFYIGNHVCNAGSYSATTSATPVFALTISGVPTGVAVDTLRAYIDYAMSPNGPWQTQGPQGTWDFTALIVSPSASSASDTTGAGATKTAYAAGSSAISPLSTQPTWRGYIVLTGVTIGSSVASPFGWEYARLRLTGDKTTSLISSVFDASVWISFPVNVADPQVKGPVYQ